MPVYSQIWIRFRFFHCVAASRFHGNPVKIHDRIHSRITHHAASVNIARISSRTWERGYAATAAAPRTRTPGGISRLRHTTGISIAQNAMKTPSTAPKTNGIAMLISRRKNVLVRLQKYPQTMP